MPMPPRRVRARSATGELTEAAFQAHVVGLARFYGWRVFHAPDNRPAGKGRAPQRLAAPEAKGFPDLVLVRPPELLFVELKTDTGRLGPGQEEWLADLAAVGNAVAHAATRVVSPGYDDGPAVQAHLWRPEDWNAGEVNAILGRGRRLETVLRLE